MLPAAVAQFDPHSWTCELDGRFVLDDTTTPELIAVTIVHEATHARLFKRGFGYVEEVRDRVEEICLRRDLAFTARLPDGARARERAAATLAALPDMSDEANLLRDLEGGRLFST